jgi:hypothetical protein
LLINSLRGTYSGKKADRHEMLKPGIVVHTYNPGIQEAEAEES